MAINTAASKRRRLGTIVMLVGILAVIGALALYVYNYMESKRAGDASDAALEQLVDAIVAGRPQAIADTGGDQGEEASSTPVTSDTPDPYSEMPTILIDGEEYIGFLTVESVGLELPVMAQWDYDKLAISPCRYSGKVWSNDLVIAAHNYDRHFGKLFNVSIGDEVVFCDVLGTKTSYQVVAVEALDPFAVTQMTAGEYDLSLFTCTYGGQARLTIRCERDQ